MRALQVDAKDNVAVMIQPCEAKDQIQVGDMLVEAAEPITMGHKIALCDIPAGGMVIKYGVPIGKASCPISKGSFVHCHNVEDITEQLCREYAAEFRRKAGETL